MTTGQPFVEYRVRPVTRYVVTRYEDAGSTGGSETLGHYDNEGMAYRVANAMGRAEEASDQYRAQHFDYVYPGPDAPKNAAEAPCTAAEAYARAVDEFGI